MTGDRFRKIDLEVPPLKHIEAEKAIKIMHAGSNLLKHVTNDNPHIRFFQLSDDNERLIYFSNVKEIKDSFILIRNIVDIIIGQTTKKFL